MKDFWSTLPPNSKDLCDTGIAPDLYIPRTHQNFHDMTNGPNSIQMMEERPTSALESCSQYIPNLRAKTDRRKTDQRTRQYS